MKVICGFIDLKLNEETQEKNMKKIAIGVTPNIRIYSTNTWRLTEELLKWQKK